MNIVRNEKGITLLALTITIFVMVIVTGTLIYNANNQVKVQKINKLYSDIELINDKVSEYYLKYNALPIKTVGENNEGYCTAEGLVTILKANGADNSKTQDDLLDKADSKVADKSTYYVIDLSKLDNLTLNHGSEYKDWTGGTEKQDLYIINEKSHHIYYSKGVLVDGKLYYSYKTQPKGDVVLPEEEYGITGLTISKPEIQYVDENNKIYIAKGGNVDIRANITLKIPNEKSISHVYCSIINDMEDKKDFVECNLDMIEDAEDTSNKTYRAQFISNRIPAGQYNMWIRIIDGEGNETITNKYNNTDIEFTIEEKSITLEMEGIDLNNITEGTNVEVKIKYDANRFNSISYGEGDLFEDAKSNYRIIGENVPFDIVDNGEKVYTLVVSKDEFLCVKATDKYDNDTIAYVSIDYSNFVNSPQLKDGMIPITYDETRGWVIADRNNPNKSWYDYKDKKWANICTVDSNHSSYRTASVGTQIPVTDMTTMFVWIPRYAYSIVDGYQTANSETPKETNDNLNKKIDIKFLVGNTNKDIYNVNYRTDYDLDRDVENGKTPMIVHPGFTFGESQLTGFWMAKFEASGTKTVNGQEVSVGNHTVENSTATLVEAETNTPVKVLPNVISWRNTTIGESQYRCMQMSNNTNTYGWSNANTHLIKNSEWGAVAYLCYSKYGVVPSKNGAAISGAGVWYNFYTGAGPQNGTTNDDGTYNYLGNETAQAYNKTKGKLASTTGNEFGVYDMSGGAWDRVAAYLDNKNSKLTEKGNSTAVAYFNNLQELNLIYSSYWDKYEVSEEERLASTENKIKITEIVNEQEVISYVNQSTLWSNSKTEKKYIQARYDLTKNIFEKMENHKGIGINEMAAPLSDTKKDSFSFYTSYAYKKGSGTATTWGWFGKVSTAVSRAGTSSGDENTAYIWNKDLVRIGHISLPFFCRGGSISNGISAGVFYTYGTNGDMYYNYGFRPVLSP